MVLTGTRVRAETPLDDVPFELRLVTSALAVARLRVTRAQLTHWVARGYLQPVACLVQNRATVYREADILAAERRTRTPQRHAARSRVA